MIRNFDFIKNSCSESSIDLDEVYRQSSEIKALLNDVKITHDLLDILIESLKIESLARVREMGEALFKSVSIYDFNLALKGVKCKPNEYVATFFDAAKNKINELRNFLTQPLPINQLRSIANSDNLSFRDLLVQYKVDSWLVAIGALDGINYDQIHKLSGYNFTHKKQPNLFAQNTSNYVNGDPENPTFLVKDKNILSIGSGNGIDEKFFLENGAKKVEVIESSRYALSLITKTRDSIQNRLKNKLVIPSSPQDMISSLDDYLQQGIKFDTIYCHSVLHYFDDPTLKHIISLIVQCLNEGGYFSFATKLPGATLDGNGIPLINDVESIKRRDDSIQNIVHLRGWLNNDTQCRFFRDRDSLINLILVNFSLFPLCHA